MKRIILISITAFFSLSLVSCYTQFGLVKSESNDWEEQRNHYVETDTFYSEESQPAQVVNNYYIDDPYWFWDDFYMTVHFGWYGGYYPVHYPYPPYYGWAYYPPWGNPWGNPWYCYDPYYDYYPSYGRAAKPYQARNFSKDGHTIRNGGSQRVSLGKLADNRGSRRITGASKATSASRGSGAKLVKRRTTDRGGEKLNSGRAGSGHVVSTGSGSSIGASAVVATGGSGKEKQVKRSSSKRKYYRISPTNDRNKVRRAKTIKTNNKGTGSRKSYTRSKSSGSRKSVSRSSSGSSSSRGKKTTYSSPTKSSSGSGSSYTPKSSSSSGSSRGYSSPSRSSSGSSRSSGSSSRSSGRSSGSRKR